jgi:hypothetical protein
VALLQVFISSMGREPVSVNGAPVTSPLELATGDKIEVLLENRTRVFYFQGDDETVQIRPPPPPTRKALADLNQGQGLQCAGAAKPAPAPAPPPPPPFGAMRGADKPAAVAPAPVPPSLPSKAAGAALASGAAGLAAALQDAIKVSRVFLIYLQKGIAFWDWCLLRKQRDCMKIRWTHAQLFATSRCCRLVCS